MKAKRGLLLLGMAIAVPCYLFVALNTLLAPRLEGTPGRLPLLALTALAAALMLGLSRAVAAHGAFFERHARALRLLAVLAFFAAQLFFGLRMRFVPGNDCATCYYGAQEWVNGGQISEYFSDWMSIVPNIFPLAVLDMLILRALRAVPFLAQVDLYYGVMAFNALCFAAGFWAMLRLAHRLRGGAGQAIFAANMALCTPMLYCASELYTDALCMPFLMLGLCALAGMIEAKGEGRAHALAALAGLAVFVGMELRMTVAIVAIAAAITAALLCRPKRLLCLVTLAAVLLAGHAGMTRFREQVLGRERLERWRMPVAHWLMMGTPDRYGYRNGTFSVEDLEFAKQFEDPQARSAALWRAVYERLYDIRYPSRFIPAYSRKLLVTFGDGTYGLRQIFDSLSQAPPRLYAVLVGQTPEHAAYRAAATGVMLAQLLFACFAVAGQIARREARAADAICALELVGLFLVLLVWESNARYFFHAAPVMLAVSALGQERAARTIPRRTERGRAQ